MEFTKSQLSDGHYYVDYIENGKSYNISLKHDALAKFIIEILDPETKAILYRPNNFLVTVLPNVPYTLLFRAPVAGQLAIHYDSKTVALDKWTRVYDLILEERP